MNKPQEIANYIILETYKNGGEIEFKQLNLEADWQLLTQVNRILKEYGNLFNELSDETWYSYSLNAHGNNFASQDAFQGLEKERKQKHNDRKLDLIQKWASIIAVVIALISLIISIQTRLQLKL